MSEALALARKGIALASPNPCVGAVLVDAEGKVIGRGTHTTRAANTPNCWRWKRTLSGWPHRDLDTAKPHHISRSS